jgi:hypothetical protein
VKTSLKTGSASKIINKNILFVLNGNNNANIECDPIFAF